MAFGHIAPNYRQLTIVIFDLPIFANNVQSVFAVNKKSWGSGKLSPTTHQLRPFCENSMIGS